MQIGVFILMVVGQVVINGGSHKPQEAQEQMGKGVKLWAAVKVSDPVLDWDNLAWELDTRGPFMIHFYVVNDGDKVVDPKLTSSRLFINGKECKGKDGINWPRIVASGPVDDRNNALPPGDYTGFGFDFGSYFKEPGIYRVKWKGEGFEASEVVFRVMPRKKVDK